MAFCLLKLFCLDIFDRLVGFYLNNDIPLALMASESIAHEARGIIVKRGRGGGGSHSIIKVTGILVNSCQLGV